MAKTLLLTPDELRARLARRFANQRSAWLGGAGDWPLRLPLGVPTESQAMVSAENVRAWQRLWTERRGPGTIRWAERRWPALGVQRLPLELELDAAEDVAEYLGERERWQLARQRFAELLAEWPQLASILPQHVELLAEWPEREFARLTDTLRWLNAHPGSGVYVRQLPIAGVDSKWIETRQAVIAAWLSAIRGDGAGSDLYRLAGLRRPGTILRLRLLDPRLRSMFQGLGDIQAPVTEVAALRLPIARAFFVENLQSGLAFGDIPGTVALMGQGYAVEPYGQLPWLREVPCHYWGDIDTHGLAILDRLRVYLPEVRSLLMNQEVLLAHRDLWGEEPKRTLATEFQRLNKEERALMDGLLSDRWGRNVRLEQERIPWPYAAATIDAEF